MEVDGSEETIDAIIWCTGFEPNLDHLAPLNVLEADGKVQVKFADTLQPIDYTIVVRDSKGG